MSFIESVLKTLFSTTRRSPATIGFAVHQQK